MYRPIPTYNDLNVMNPQQHVALIQDLLDGWDVPIHTLETNKDQGLVVGVCTSSSTSSTPRASRLTNDEASRLAYLCAAEHANTNWFKELYRQ